MKVFHRSASNRVHNNNNNNNIANHVLFKNSSKILEEFGWFQIRSLIFISFLYFGLGMSVLSFVFLNIVPPYQCGSQQENETNYDEGSSYLGENDLQSQDSEIQSQCYSLFDQNNKFENEQRPLNTTLEKKSCLDNLIFNTSNEVTAVSQFKMVCEHAWKRPLSIVCFMVGMFFGSLLGGTLPDRFGRRLTSLIAASVAAVLFTATAFSPTYLCYVLLLFIDGSLWTILYNTNFTWVLELAGRSNRRLLASLFINVTYVSGGILLSFVVYCLKDRMWILVVTGVLLGISVPFLWFVTESPDWLIQQKDYNQAAKVLKSIATTNKIHIDHIYSTSTERQKSSDACTVDSKDNLDTKMTASLIWKNKTMRKRCFLIVLLWNSCIMTYLTLSLNSANFGGSPLLNNLMGSGLEVVSVFVFTFALKHHGRKKTLVLVLGLLGCICVATPLAKKENLVAGVVTAMVGRFLAAPAIMIVVLICGEIFPTLLRNTGIGIASTASRPGLIISPFIIFIGEEVDLSIPFYIIGGMSFASIYLVLLLPETSNPLLLNTLEDALALKDPKALQCCQVRSISEASVKTTTTRSDEVSEASVE